MPSYTKTRTVKRITRKIETAGNPVNYKDPQAPPKVSTRWKPSRLPNKCLNTTCKVCRPDMPDEVNSGIQREGFKVTLNIMKKEDTRIDTETQDCGGAPTITEGDWEEGTWEIEDTTVIDENRNVQYGYKHIIGMDNIQREANDWNRMINNGTNVEHEYESYACTDRNTGVDPSSCDCMYVPINSTTRAAQQVVVAYKWADRTLADVQNDITTAIADFTQNNMPQLNPVIEEGEWSAPTYACCWSDVLGTFPIAVSQGAASKCRASCGSTEVTGKCNGVSYTQSFPNKNTNYACHQPLSATVQVSVTDWLGNSYNCNISRPSSSC